MEAQTFSMYHVVLRGMQAAAAALPFIGTVVDAPFGKFGLPSRWNVHGNGGWMVMECVAPLITTLAFFSAPTHHEAHASAWLLLGLFLLHYTNRAVIQPLLNAPRSPLHISVVLSAMAFNAANGFLMGTWLAHGGSVPPPGMNLWGHVGLLLYVLGFVGNVYHDALLRSLRMTPPASSEEVVRVGSCIYRIPQGGLFRWMSYPHYFCEWIEWSGYALVCITVVPHVPDALVSYPPVLFVMLEVGAMLPRAMRGHAWYQRHFSNYPTRWAIVPFV